MKNRGIILPSFVLAIIFYLIITPIRIYLINNSLFRVDSDLSESWGETAQILLLISFTYVVIHYLFKYRDVVYEYTKKGLEKIDKFDPDVFDKVKMNFKIYYKKFRKPLQYIHGALNLTASILGGLHGYQMIVEADGLTLISGVLLFSLMALVSIGGFLVLFRVNYKHYLRSINRELRIIHKQWFYTIIILITLLIHTD